MTVETLIAVIFVVGVAALYFLKRMVIKSQVDWDGEGKNVEDNIRVIDGYSVLGLLCLLLFVVTQISECRYNPSNDIIDQRNKIVNCCRGVSPYKGDPPTDGAQARCCVELARFDSLYLNNIITTD